MNNSVLSFFLTYLGEISLKTTPLLPPYHWSDELDAGLRTLLFGSPEENENTAKNPPFTEEILGEARTRDHITILTDPLYCKYILIPDPESEVTWICGPYIDKPVNIAHFRKLSFKQKIPEIKMEQIIPFYTTLKVIEESNTLLALLHTLSVEFYGNGFEIVDAAQNAQVVISEAHTAASHLEGNPAKRLEERYKMEEAGMACIARGDYSGAIKYFGKPEFQKLEIRTRQPIRTKKNYLIVGNTLYRKAAERAHVHPLYLNEISRKCAIEIENISSEKELDQLSKSMIKRYCNLVLSHASENYPEPIRSVVNYISFNLVADLSLTALAKQYNLNKSYLCTRFKETTGMSLTAFVTKQRMEHAVYLLNLGAESIQEVADACGISDLSYFTKLFKKEKGMTPTEYKEMLKG